MDNKTLEEYRAKVRKADEINRELDNNKMLLQEVEGRMHSITENKGIDSISFLGVVVGGEVAFSILEHAQCVLRDRNIALHKEYEKL